MLTEDRPRYKGFLIDLLEDMKKRSPRPLDYELYTSPDGSYGVETRYENGTITWNGMIGELVKEVRFTNACSSLFQLKFRPFMETWRMDTRQKRESIVRNKWSPQSLLKRI